MADQCAIQLWVSRAAARRGFDLAPLAGSPKGSCARLHCFHLATCRITAVSFAPNTADSRGESGVAPHLLDSWIPSCWAYLMRVLSARRLGVGPVLRAARVVYADRGA